MDEPSDEELMRRVAGGDERAFHMLARLYRVVVNLCLNRKRRAPFASLADAGDLADPHPDAAAQLESDQRDRAVAEAIARLPERQRAAIVLTFHEGLSNAEAAAVLGASRSAVETLLVRAKRSLRRQLGSIAIDDASGE